MLEDQTCLIAEFDEFDCCLYNKSLLSCQVSDATDKFEKAKSSPSYAPSVCDRYENYLSYVRTYSSLLYLEAEENQIRIESQVFDSIVVKWDLNNETAEFSLPLIAHVVRFGEKISISSGIESLELRIIDAPKVPGDKIIAQFEKEDVPFSTDLPTYIIQMLYDETTYIRCKRALDQLSSLYKHEEKKSVSCEIEEHETPLQSSLSRHVRDVLLGVQVPHKINNCVVNGRKYGPLNDSQAESITKAFQFSMSLVKGPPGTGKTTTAAAMVQAAVEQNLRVLVCAPSNTATNNLLEKISNRIPDAVVRLCSQPTEFSSPVLSQYFLQDRLLQKENVCSYTNNYINLKKMEYLTKTQRNQLRRFQIECEKFVLEKYPVVFSTCCGAGDSRLKHLEFDFILIDESTQDNEPSCLIPIMKGSPNVKVLLVIYTKVVLIGDNKQLGPVILSDNASRRGFNYSMFERLININLPTTMLNVQFRMHPGLSIMSNIHFYDGHLTNGVTQENRIHNQLKGFWPQTQYPTALCATFGEEKIIDKSICNELEARVVYSIVIDLLKRGVKNEEIAVIASYTAQIKLLQQILKGLVQIATVNGYQGKEKNFIIFSLVRSNQQGYIGFVESLQRLNVAITRAKYGLFIVGNPLTFINKPVWHEIILAYSKEGLMFDGYTNKQFMLASNVQKHPAKSTNEHLVSIRNTNAQFTKDEFVSNTMGHIAIHNFFIGAIIGLNGEIIDDVSQKFNSKIYIEPVNIRKTSYVSVTITTKQGSIKDAILKLKELVNIEREARLGRELRFQEGYMCREFHLRPTSAEIDNVFKIIQSHPTFIEFSIRHDIAGTILGRNANIIQQFKEEYFCTLVLGYKREFRCLMVYANPGCKSLKEIPQILKEKISFELDNYRANAK